MTMKGRGNKLVNREKMLKNLNACATKYDFGRKMLKNNEKRRLLSASGGTNLSLLPHLHADRIKTNWFQSLSELSTGKLSHLPKLFFFWPVLASPVLLL